jgi:hypothetical protein
LNYYSEFVRADYSATPQAQKLGLKLGQRVALISPPTNWTFTDPPDEISFVRGKQHADLILAFFTKPEELVKKLPALSERIFPAGALWIAWPRRAAGHISEITDNLVRSAALEIGLVDINIAAIDHDWSGQKVVWRITNRKL